MAKPQSPQKRELMLGVKQFLGGYGCECGGGDSRRELRPRVVEQRLRQATVQQGGSQGVRLLLEPPIGLTWWEEKGQGRPGVHSSEVSPPGPGAGWGKVGGHRRGQQKLFSTAPLWAEGKATSRQDGEAWVESSICRNRRRCHWTCRLEDGCWRATLTTCSLGLHRRRQSPLARSQLFRCLLGRWISGRVLEAHSKAGPYCLVLPPLENVFTGSHFRVEFSAVAEGRVNESPVPGAVSAALFA